MKRKLLHLLLAIILVLPSIIYAQAKTDPVIYKDWTPFGEQGNEIEVEYRVIKCNDVNQIHLFIFNENVTDKNVQFTLEITDATANQKFSKDISFQTQKLTMYKSECNSDGNLAALKFNLPANYNPSNLTLKITFKQ